MPRKLKVFRTPIGFYDAYVAAPSRKAALAAWGSAHDLFARGVAEEVTDPEFTRQPLANPGQVIRLSRGSAAEQIAALGKTAGPRRRKSAKAPEAAEIMRVTAPDLLKLGVIDGIVPEPVGGAHRNWDATAASLRAALHDHLWQLRSRSETELIEERQEKFRRIGVFEETV